MSAIRMILSEQPRPPYPDILYYLPSLNRFADHNGIIVHDLHRLFDTWQLAVWKREKQDSVMVARDGREMMLYYMVGPEEEEMLYFLAYDEYAGVKTDRACY